MSHAAEKSFDRGSVSCKKGRTVQFSGGVEKCPVTQKTVLPLAVYIGRIQSGGTCWLGDDPREVNCEQYG